MRIFPLVSIVTAYNEVSRCGFENIPILYMNLDSQVERRMRLTEMFPEAIRIRAVDGRNATELLSRLDHDLDPQEFSKENLVNATKKHFKAFPAGYEYMILAEDDVAAPLCGILPSTLDRVIKQLNEVDPEWEVLRLQWTVKGDSMYKMKKGQLNRLGELVHELGDEYRQSLLETYGAWENAPVLGRFTGGWGNVFNVWHRRAMKKFTEKYGGRIVSGIQRWKCPDGDECISNGLFVRQSTKHSYVVLPPWVQNEPGERGSLIREGRSNHRFHLSAVALSTQWLVELREFVRRGAQDLYPDPELVWRAVKRRKP
ncbi:hypothetical protein GNI_099430 [Gregarina niphandrodes]|uniref:Uncharacterized protein n=1 Tax=Gregarina niphandrodes TaxID=110365 RepID=A0A023B4M5_GRENI|nr:hypothetical protein GNI_099430 [Gregarina niphandrodes]EZG57123.1 hypothetical protein GNI_099430 [Gregarina niphandrodes]|eukprot:XP_011131106.1 hypothetical protein GNI_099430 [Gregarina niphandrodes]